MERRIETTIYVCRLTAQHLLKRSTSLPRTSFPKEVSFLNIEQLKRRAFHLRRRIDTLEDGQQKQRLIKDYVKIIWQIQNN